ncbi:glucanotransferase domain of glycogen debranching enzyme-domain-containing protein [Entophlyctis helioformis]|nr:glucanotransferase domain of glycogen debranching enzyme-domain-containing protein [Entophlyctis helioformis]
MIALTLRLGDGGSPEGPKKHTLLPLDGITILTVIPKWMPTISRWPSFFQTFSDGGYNMVHFAPINQRGISDSPYSIYDQLSLSDDLFDEPALPEQEKEDQMKDMLVSIHQTNKILSITDIVWNHTACNSSWLLHHPEAGYNLKTAPHLRPAYELDEAIIQFSEDIHAVHGLPDTISSEADLSAVLAVFSSKILPSLNLWQFFVVDAKASVDAFRVQWKAAKTGPTSVAPPYDPDRYKSVNLGSLPLKERAQVLARDALEPGKTHDRFSKTINVSTAMAFVHKLCLDLGVTDIDKQVEQYAALVDEVNLPLYQETDADIAVIKEQIGNRARYLRIAEHGPRLGPVTRVNPIVDTYFTRLPVNDITKGRDAGELALANNGWIWNADPLVNFAAEGSKAYFRREVIPWGDCVKLRYGDGPQDSPWLWKHQIEYTSKMARLFHGLRIDNCHSTPIHVAQYLLDVARSVNPDLYVFAELFTGSEEKDILFVSKLGINSLIREAMNAWDPHELSRQVHRQGGSPVGSLALPAEYFPLDMVGHSLNSTFYEPCSADTEIVVELRGSTPHNLFMDCTHDNETPHQKRTAEDTLPNAAVVAMTMSAIGSVKGYDEIVPELLNVVKESRKYRLPDSFEGIIPAKSILNSLHTKMAREGYCEIHVNQEHDFISIHRVHPVTHDGYLLIARCAFRGNRSDQVHSPIILRNQCVHVLESATLASLANLGSAVHLEFSTYLSHITHAFVEQIGDSGDIQTAITVDASQFKPGSIVLYRTWVLWYSSHASRWPPGLYEAVKGLSDVDINLALYRTGPEEAELTGGDSVYDIPGFGPLPYCGLQGIVSALVPSARNNDMGASLFSNIRQGPWLANYTIGRLEKLAVQFPGLWALCDWIKTRLRLVSSLSAAFVPKYFAIVIMAAYQGVKFRALTLSTDTLALRHPEDKRASSLVKFGESCVMTAFQLYGSVQSTGLLPKAYPLHLPGGGVFPRDPCLAAGLPHFATNHMRCWGRDIFIALRGLFLIPGHFPAARAHIIAFGSTLRHGLIPNLLDQGIRPRYNARDATWFWFRSVRDYCRYSPEGYAFLGAPVARRFIPKRRYTSGPDFCVAPDHDAAAEVPDADTYIDPSDPRVYQSVSTIAELCQEVLDRHARGIRFREWNAGTQLDHAMRSEGFDISIDADLAVPGGTGLVRGGNRWNCGTWMDKMGDSDKAGIKGVPATPRDGSPVEIIGLIKGVLHWIASDVSVKGKMWWKWTGVHIRNPAGGSDRHVSYADWDKMLVNSFEACFYIPIDPAEDRNHLIDRKELINRRGIYKDVYGSSLAYMDYQLRPNMCVAMVAAPELFNPDHARTALSLIKSTLAGPLGIKTLDPTDWAYRGVYDNANDSSDPTVAHGFNYHQGPEWVWVNAFFLRAYIHFFTRAPGHDKDRVDSELMWVQRQLMAHKQHINDTAVNPFAGLPELTNEGGAKCHGSCPTQAWSSAVMLEVTEDLGKHRRC